MAAVKHDSLTDIIKGQLFLFVDGLPIAFGKNVSLSITGNTVNASNKMVGDWEVHLPGKKSFTVTSESLVSEKEGHMGFPALFKKMQEKEPIDFVFGQVIVTGQTNTGADSYAIDTTKTSYQGKVLLTKLELTSSDGELATSSIEGQGTGSLDIVDPVSAPAGS